MSTGIVVFAHGSRVAAANDAVRAVAASLARAAASEHVEAAFLELAHPNLEVAVMRLVGRECTRVVVLPYFLTLGTHLERDLPALAKAVADRFKELDLIVAGPLDGHPALVRILLDRLTSAIPKT